MKRKDDMVFGLLVTVIAIIILNVIAAIASGKTLRYTGEGTSTATLQYGDRWTDTPPFELNWTFDVYTDGNSVQEGWATAEHVGVIPFASGSNQFFEGELRFTGPVRMPLQTSQISLGEFVQRGYPGFDGTLEGTYTSFGSTNPDFTGTIRAPLPDNFGGGVAPVDWDFVDWPNSIDLLYRNYLEMFGNGVLLDGLTLRGAEIQVPQVTMQRAPITGSYFLDWQRRREPLEADLEWWAVDFGSGAAASVGGVPEPSTLALLFATWLLFAICAFLVQGDRS